MAVTNMNLFSVLKIIMLSSNLRMSFVNFDHKKNQFQISNKYKHVRMLWSLIVISTHIYFTYITLKTHSDRVFIIKATLFVYVVLDLLHTLSIFIYDIIHQPVTINIVNKLMVLQFQLHKICRTNFNLSAKELLTVVFIIYIFAMAIIHNMWYFISNKSVSSRWVNVFYFVVYINLVTFKVTALARFNIIHSVSSQYLNALNKSFLSCPRIKRQKIIVIHQNLCHWLKDINKTFSLLLLSSLAFAFYNLVFGIILIYCRLVFEKKGLQMNQFSEFSINVVRIILITVVSDTCVTQVRNSPGR
jgi:hypothetical protein